MTDPSSAMLGSTQGPGSTVLDLTCIDGPGSKIY